MIHSALHLEGECSYTGSGRSFLQRSYYNSITIDAHLCSPQCLDKSQVNMNYSVVEAIFSRSGQSWGGAKSNYSSSI